MSSESDIQKSIALRLAQIELLPIYRDFDTTLPDRLTSYAFINQRWQDYRDSTRPWSIREHLIGRDLLAYYGVKVLTCSESFFRSTPSQNVEVNFSRTGVDYEENRINVRRFPGYSLDYRSRQVGFEENLSIQTLEDSSVQQLDLNCEGDSGGFNIQMQYKSHSQAIKALRIRQT